MMNTAFERYFESLKGRKIVVLFSATQVYKPGSVLTALYLAPWLPLGSSRLLGTAGSA